MTTSVQVFVDPSGRRAKHVGRLLGVLAALLGGLVLLVVVSLLAPPGLIRLSVPGVGQVLPGPGAPSLQGRTGQQTVTQALDGPSATPSPAVPTPALPSPGSTQGATAAPNSAAPSSLPRVPPAPAPALAGPAVSPTPRPAASVGPTTGTPTTTPTPKRTGKPTANPAASPRHGRPTPKPT